MVINGAQISGREREVETEREREERVWKGENWTTTEGSIRACERENRERAKLRVSEQIN